MGRRLEGFAAKYPSVCSRCNRGINVGDRVVRQGSGVIHTYCHSGYDDE